MDKDLKEWGEDKSLTDSIYIISTSEASLFIERLLENILIAFNLMHCTCPK